MRWPHWLDWRTLATLVAAALVLLLGWVVLDASRGRQEAFRALEATAEQGIDIRRAQTARISELLDQVGSLNVQVGALSEDVRVLRRQIEERGDDPRVPPRSTTTTTTTTTTQPPDEPQPPPEEPEPPEDPPTCIFGVCVP